MKKIIILLALLMAFYGCVPETTIEPDNTEQGGSETTGGDDSPNIPDDPDTPDNPDKPDTPDNPDQPDSPDNPDGEVELTVVDPGEEYTETKPVPQHPELEHEISYSDFYNSLQDELDEYGNLDYVCAQGNGTSFPIITDAGYIRFYQGTSSKSGGYLRIRAHNGAKIISVSVGTATPTSLAYSLEDKVKKYDPRSLKAGEKYEVNVECSEIRIHCMGTSQNERWEMNYIYVKYRGGFVASDFDVAQKEYGPLVRVKLPFKEGFETGFPTTEKPSYYKYGIQAGRENLQWSTWFGSFSWQDVISGSQTAQLRVYKEDPEYDQDQFGYLKMEFFIENLSKVSFSYRYSEFWCKATIAYCEFGSSEWKNPQTIALENYSERKTIRNFVYNLDKKSNAKIRIKIDSSTGFPSSDHYDFQFDDFVFE